MWFLSALVGLAVICYSHAEYNNLVVQTTSGAVQGWERVSRGGRVYQAWTGIPYAETPIGELRFMPPKPKNPWDGVLNATVDAPICLQAVIMVGSGLVGSEDCLYVNVYRPENKENMPVLVYVHGGAYQNGNMGPREAADYLMDEDVVLVTVQYRLNALGFMSLGDAVMPGNFGLKDQVQALRWVNQNIAKFGGNPNSVTVFGESAGGSSTHTLLKSPATDDLVHRAVSDSGTITRFWSLLDSDSVKETTLGVARMSGCTSHDSQQVLKCLQTVDATVILTNMMKNSNRPLETGFYPVIEPSDAVDPVATFDLSTRPTEKPWMTSTSNGEWLLFRFMMVGRKFPNIREYLVEYLSGLHTGLSKSKILGAAEILEKFYFSTTDPKADPINDLSKLQADVTFIYPALANIGMHKGPKWIYRYEYVDELSMFTNNMFNITENPPVASHAAPVSAYLNRRSSVPMLGPVEKPEDTEVSKRMIKYLVNFAYHDNPTPEASPFQWKQFNGTEILRITGSGDVFAEGELLREIQDIYALWDTVVGWGNRK